VGALACEDADWELKYVCWTCECEGPFSEGEESGASILGIGMLTRVVWRCESGWVMSTRTNLLVV
jgi:hypothetical protein